MKMVDFKLIGMTTLFWLLILLLFIIANLVEIREMDSNKGRKREKNPKER